MNRVWFGASLLIALSWGLDEKNFKEPPPIWGYDRPQEWGGVCQSEPFQSPITINASAPVAAHPHLVPVVLTSQCRFLPEFTMVLLESNYRTVEVRLPTNASAQHLTPGVGPCAMLEPNSGQLYPFVRFHFHIGAEHLLEHSHVDAELHAVFQQSSGKTAVVAVRLRRGTSSGHVGSTAFFNTIFRSPLPAAGESSTVSLKRPIGLDDVFPASDGSYDTYEGSLTTPPCTGGVRWVVFTAVQEIPSDVFGKIRGALSAYMPKTFGTYGNARPAQEVRGRAVFKFRDPTSTTTNRWIIGEDEELRMVPSNSGSAVPTTETKSFVMRHAFGLFVGVLCFATIGLLLRLREQPLEVGVSDAARDAATYGTMET